MDKSSLLPFASRGHHPSVERKYQTPILAIGPDHANHPWEGWKYPYNWSSCEWENNLKTCSTCSIAFLRKNDMICHCGPSVKKYLRGKNWQSGNFPLSTNNKKNNLSIDRYRGKSRCPWTLIRYNVRSSKSQFRNENCYRIWTRNCYVNIIL